MTGRISRAFALMLVLVATPALAGIEEHSPDPSPEMNLLDGYNMGRSFEGLNIRDPNDSGAEEQAPVAVSYAKDVMVPDVATDMQLQWMFARMGILYGAAPTLPAPEGMAHTPPTQVRRDRRGAEAVDLTRPLAEDPESAPLETTSAPLASDEQDEEAAAGCSVAATGPSSGAALVLLLTWVALRPRRREPLAH